MKSITDVLRRQNKQSETNRRRQPPSSRRDLSLAKTSRDFKRGRTMPGATSSGIKAADKHALRSATPREKINHLAYVRRMTVTALAGLVIGAIVLLVVVWQFTATATLDYQASGLKAFTTKAYSQAIQAYLADHPTERLRFLLDDQNLTEYVQQSYPEIANIAVAGNDGFATTSFAVELRQPVVSWQVSDTVYYVDAEGVSFTQNYFKPPVVEIVDNSSIQYTPGTAIASERFLSFVGRIIANIETSSKLSVAKIEIPTGTTHQVKVYLKGYSYPAFVSIERGPAVQAEDIKRSLKYIQFEGKQPQYIDVRVKGKVFYRE